MAVQQVQASALHAGGATPAVSAGHVNTQIPDLRVNTQIPDLHANTQIPDLHANTQIPDAHLTNTQTPDLHSNTQIPDGAHIVAASATSASMQFIAGSSDAVPSSGARPGASSTASVMAGFSNPAAVFQPGTVLLGHAGSFLQMASSQGGSSLPIHVLGGTHVQIAGVTGGSTIFG